MSEENGIVKDEAGNVTVLAPTATASAKGLIPGTGTEPPEFIVYNHEGQNVLYRKEG